MKKYQEVTVDVISLSEDVVTASGGDAYIEWEWSDVQQDNNWFE